MIRVYFNPYYRLIFQNLNDLGVHYDPVLRHVVRTLTLLYVILISVLKF